MKQATTLGVSNAFPRNSNNAGLRPVPGTRASLLGTSWPQGISVLATLVALGIVGCGGGGSGGGQGSGNAGGTALAHIPNPDGTFPLGSKTMTVDPNQGGQSQSLKIVRVSWGRLVDVVDENDALQQRDMAIPESIETDHINYELDIELGTDRNVLRILHPAGTPQYEQAYEVIRQSAFESLTPVTDKSLDPSELPPFSLVPRNSSMIVQFNDLLDASLINGDTVKVVTGNPPITTFEARVTLDVNHGDLVDRDDNGTPEFYTTRVILDTTLSTLEADQSNPPLQANPVGLPGSVTTNQANVALRIPTKKVPDVGQLEILRNLSGHPVSFVNNGSIDPLSPTQDVVRAVRSGGSTAVTGDIHNGFLLDEIPPSVVGTQPVLVSNPEPDPLNPGEFTANISFMVNDCALALKAGSLIEVPGPVYFKVVADTGAPSGTILEGVRFQPVVPDSPFLNPGQAQVTTRFDSQLHLNKHPCFVQFTDINLPPNNGVRTDSKVLVKFSEPMDPVTVVPFDTLMIVRSDTTAPQANDLVVGGLEPLESLKTFQFVPSLPFQSTLGPSDDDYFVVVVSGETGATDLAGNPLSAALPPVEFQIATTEPTQDNGGLVLRFNSGDELQVGTTVDPEDGIGDGLPELRGQFLIDFTQARIRPRSVSRYAGLADRSQAIPSIMIPFAQGVQTPLSGLGSKMHTIWRYCDMGFGLLDESNMNVDIEGIDWAPVGGAAVADSFSRFEISLAHSSRLPDESINAALLPNFPNSGLQPTYAQNLLDAQEDPLKIVHPREKGYIVNPADVFPADSGTLMMPFPLNRGIPISQFQYYTWRDTAVLAKGGLGECPGAELPIVCIVILGINPPLGCAAIPYTNSQVPTIGLPILMEFKAFPEDEALGLNSFDINLALNSSARPNFRAFSTGGVNNTGQVIIKDPDLELIADGGFNPAANGAVTQPGDNTFYLGQLDLVLRVSRAHTIFFSTSPIATPQYVPPVVEPRPEDQPTGTEIVLAYRGAINVTGNLTTNGTQNAAALDAYGNTSTTAAPTFLNGDATWKDELPDLNGARFFQVRITFLSNTETLLTPSVSALGFAWKKP